MLRLKVIWLGFVLVWVRFGLGLGVVSVADWLEVGALSACFGFGVDGSLFFNGRCLVVLAVRD